MLIGTLPPLQREREGVEKYMERIVEMQKAGLGNTIFLIIL